MTMTKKAQAVLSVCNVPSSDQNIPILVIFAFFFSASLYYFWVFLDSLPIRWEEPRPNSDPCYNYFFFCFENKLSSSSDFVQVKKILPKLQAVKQRTGDVMISWTDTH